MEIKLPLRNPILSDGNLKELKSELKEECKIYIWSDASAIINEADESIFNLWVEYGKELEKTMMFNVNLDDLELFAHTLLKKIDMVRRDHKELISTNIRKGYCV